MRSFLLGLVFTLAAAASFIVISDRFREGGAPADIASLRARLAALESQRSPASPEGSPSPTGAQDPGPAPAGGPLSRGAPTLSEVVNLLVEVEQMILDQERNLRDDLKGIYERLLARMEGLEARAVAPADDGAAREALRSRLVEMGVKVTTPEMLEVTGQTLEPNRALELLAVAPGGRSHESLLLIDCVPSALKIGLEDIGLVETEWDKEAGRFPPEAKGAYLYVLWEGLKHPRRLEDMVLNRATNDTMPRTSFAFTASRIFTDTRTWERHFAADLYKNVVAATWNYSDDALLACPLEEAADENIWAPCPETCPPPGTKVRVFFRSTPDPAWDSIR